MDFTGTSGDDDLVGTSGGDLFKVWQGGDDIVSGAGGNDVFNFGAAFTAADQIDGGSGADKVLLNGDYSAGVTFAATTMVNVETLQLAAGHDYAFTTNDATVAAGATLTVNASALGAGNHLTFDGSAETDGNFHIRGGAGDDVVAMGAHLTAGDQIDGRTGNDTLTLDGDYDLTFRANTLRNIDDIVLAGGHDYELTPNSETVAHGATMTIDASALGAGDALTFHGGQAFGNLSFDATPGLMQIATGSGNDTFYMGGDLTHDDRINGGTGNDTVYLAGDYNLTLAKATLQNIHTLSLAGGFDYNITTGGGIAADATMTLNATQLTAGDTLVFNAHKETVGSLIVDAGAGTATLTGGQQGDIFDFSASDQPTFSAADSIDGQGGYDRLILDGGYSGAHALVLGAASVVNVEEFDLKAGHSYDITSNDATVAAGANLTVDASTLGASKSLTFDGSAETDGTFTLIGGAGNDTLTGGAGADIFDLTHGGNDTATGGGGDDTFVMGATLNQSDRIDGGADSLGTVVLDGGYTGAGAITINATALRDLASIDFDAGYSYDFTYTSTEAPGHGVVTFDASALGAGDSLTLDISAIKYGTPPTVIGGAGDDDILGAKDGTIDLSEGGNDTADLQGGTAIMGAALTTGDVLTHVGTLVLDGNYDTDDGTALDLTLANVHGVSGGATAILDGGDIYEITVSSATVISNVQIESGQTTGLFFDGTAETTKSFSFDLSDSGHATIWGGGGNDSVTSSGATVQFQGNDGNDTIEFTGTYYGSDQFNGGDGNDTLIIDHPGEITFSGPSLISVENIELKASGSLTMIDNNVAAGATLTITADAGGLGFDGQAETDGHYDVIAAAGSNNISGGALSDTLDIGGSYNTIEGNGGGDLIELSTGTYVNELYYEQVSDSTSVNYDTIQNLDFDHDYIQLSAPLGSQPSAIDAAVTSGALSTASFDADLAAAIGAGQLGVHHAVLFTPDSGSLSGQTFLIVDTNGTAGYQAGADLVIDVTGAIGTLTVGSF
jgi:hypothetical protein